MVIRQRQPASGVPIGQDRVDRRRVGHLEHADVQARRRDREDREPPRSGVDQDASLNVASSPAAADTNLVAICGWAAQCRHR